MIKPDHRLDSLVEPHPERFEVLDGLRGICALMVALFHLDVVSHVWGVPLLRNAYLFVDFFFVLSGFVIAHAYGRRLTSLDATGQFMIRRFGRVWPLHAAVAAAFIGLELAKLCAVQWFGITAGEAPFAPQGRASLANLPSNLLLLHGLGFDDRLSWNLPSWSISAEFWTYAVFAAVSLAIPRSRIVVLAGLAFICLALIVMRASRGMDATFDLGFPRAILGFSLGVFVHELRRKPLVNTGPAIAALEWLAVAFSAAFVSVAGKGPLSFGAPAIFAGVVYVFSFESGAVSRWLRQRPFQSLGLWSYSIYMVHDLVSYTMSLALSMSERLFGVRIWRDLPIDGETARIADFGSPFFGDGLTAIYLITVVALSALTYNIFEQPGRRWFNHLAGRLLPQRARLSYATAVSARGAKPGSD